MWLEWLSKWIRVYAELFCTVNKKGLTNEETVFAEAHSDWLVARQFFNYATDPDLVDYAIHSLQASEKRYVYLWKQARQKRGWEVKQI